MKDACFQDHGSSASVESVGRQTTPRWSTTMSSVDPGAHEQPRRGGKGPTKGAGADSFLDRILFWRSVRNDIASMRANIESSTSKFMAKLRNNANATQATQQAAQQAAQELA